MSRVFVPWLLISIFAFESARSVADAQPRTIEILPTTSQPAAAGRGRAAELQTIASFDRSSLWEGHRPTVIGVLAAFGATIIALAVLLAQIRKRHKVEKHLKESDERLNFAAASGGIGFWQYDLPKNELWSSEHCRTMFGLDPGTPLTTDALLRCVHPDDRHVAAASIRAASYGQLSETVIEFRIVGPDGRVRWIQGRGHSTADSHGHPVRVSGIFRDLTAYRNMQRQAKDLSQRILCIQDEERQRIAQEIHDSTAQHLTAINLNLMALRGANGSTERAAPLITDIQSSLTAAMQELRTFTYLLYPQELTRSGLLQTLSSYIDGFSQRTGLRVSLRATRQLEGLSQHLQQSVLRIVQESLANVHRHACASRAVVKVQKHGHRLHLLIADNGIGLKSTPTADHDANEVLTLGVGIPGMAARARQLGGHLDVRSRSTGTVVRAVLPLELEPAGARLRVVSATMSNAVRQNRTGAISGATARQVRLEPLALHRER